MWSTRWYGVFAQQCEGFPQDVLGRIYNNGSYRAEILIIALGAKKAKLIDIEIPNDNNISTTVGEKLRKYQELPIELKVVLFGKRIGHTNNNINQWSDPYVNGGRPHIVLIESNMKTAEIIDIAVPNDGITNPVCAEIKSEISNSCSGVKRSVQTEQSDRKGFSDL
ncbi:unnamed protein product [Nezara viridula]|uniref:Uncharacterized protein n=1 Tax=Nezara viridula TaxID=85310 RepID=A0A9P0MRN9_NEZVI|nr:unnamed protein product [Nezara viridula]